MRNVVITATILASCALFAAPALAEMPAPQPAKTPPDAPKGWIVLDEDFWIPLIREPGMYFHRAHREFLEKDYGLSAIDLRQASAHVRLQARRSTFQEHAAALYTAANRLDNLADQVEQKKLKNVSQLDREFARTHYALAENDAAMARESWKKDHAFQTGHHLNAAVLNLESGFSWAHQDMGKAGFTATAEASQLADELISGASKSYEVNATLDSVNNAVHSLSETIEKLPYDSNLDATSPTVATVPDFLPGWTLVEEDIWTSLADTAGRHMHDAYEAYLRKEPEKAGRALHAAIFDIELQAGRAQGEDKTSLMNAIHDLEGLLVSSNDSAVDVYLPYQKFDRTFADVCYALAQHHCQKANHDWSDQLRTATGYDLKWAAEYFDRGRVWAGQVGNTAARTTLQDARTLANDLIAGNSGTGQDVQKQVGALEHEVNTLRDALALATP